MAESVTLGDIDVDMISGWEGVAEAEFRYLNGCVRVQLSWADEHGKPESFVFDVQQIKWKRAGRLANRRFHEGGVIGERPPDPQAAYDKTPGDFVLAPAGGPRDATPPPRR